MTQAVLVGVDAGTTSVKALLLTPEGQELAVGRAPTEWTPSAFGEETTGASLAGTARAALGNALAQRPDARVLAVGVASMGESGVLADAADEPVAPVIAWHDHRDDALTGQLAAELPDFCSRTGLPFLPQWSLTKHRWLRENAPESLRGSRRYNVAEWIVRSLGGEPCSELSLASRTGWLDLATGRPWVEALAWSGADETMLANLVPAGTPIGTVRADGPLAALAGATLTVAGHDHQVAAVGLGCHSPGDEFDSCGTAEAITRTSLPGLPRSVIDELVYQGITLGWNALRDHWCLMGATQGGLALGKVLAALGVERDDLPRLDDAALGAADVPDAVSFGPAAGDVRINPAATEGEVWRAATIGVTAQAADLSDVLTRASGPRADLVVSGGWTHSRALMDAKSRALGELHRATTQEAGCRGAALLAGLAAGVYSGFPDMPVAASRV